MIAVIPPPYRNTDATGSTAVKVPQYPYVHNIGLEGKIMKTFRFAAIDTTKAAINAVRRDGGALQFVLNFDLAVEIGAKIGVAVER